MEQSPITVRSVNHSYSVIVEEGIRKEAHSLIQEHINKNITRYFIISDDEVAKHYLNDVVNSFPEGVEVGQFIVPHGEEAKSFQQYEEVMTAALSFHLDRRSLIIALGGGVVGDLAGFVAATYMRGIPFVQMPTTLLAHDSSVGGKVGINHPLGKNMVGAFHAPSLVIYDTECLLSLPEKEWRSGFAEVIKHGFIHSEDFLQWLENNVTSLSDWDMDNLKEMLLRSIQVKANIVEEDEKEQGVRAYLNFGHTLGHAIEAVLGYGKMTHGEAVVIGMMFALRLSEKYFQTSIPYERYTDMLKELGFQLEIPKGLTKERLLTKMKSDKKSYNQQVHFVLMKEIGNPEVVSLSEAFILEELKKEVEANGEGS